MKLDKPKRYQVLWDCPKCGNSHNWWWEDKFEAWDDGECDMVCDRCMEPSRCKGDGMGFYEAVEKEQEGLTDSISQQVKDLYDAVNALAKRLANLEDSPKKNLPSILNLIHGVKPPFHERFREGCGFTEETLPGEDIAKMLRFIAVEVERMTERDMGGSFTISNLKVGEKLRELADEAEWSDEDPDNPALAEDGN